MSSLLSADDLNDFIRPGVACIIPVEDKNSKKGTNKDEHLELEVENEDELELEIGTNGDVLQVQKESEDGGVSKPNKKKLEKAQISLADCLACSGCITSSEEVLVSQHSYQEFLNFWKGHQENRNEEIHYVLSLSQQARASLANAFDVDIEIMDVVVSKIFTDYYGFENVVSVGVARRLIYKELYEEIEKNRETNQTNKSILSSICPGWVLYVEKTHPNLIEQMSKIKSPQFITSKLAKELLKKYKQYEYEQVYTLSIMPCFDKKLEASRDSEVVDCVITPKELISMIEENEDIDIFKIIDDVKEKIIKCENAQDEYIKFIKSITPKGWYNGNLYGWGNDVGDESGGYAIAYLEYYKRKHFGKNGNQMDLKVIKGRNEDIYEIQLIDKSNGEVLRRSGVINGFKNIQNLVRKLKNGDGNGNNHNNKEVKKGRGLLSRRKRGIDQGNNGNSSSNSSSSNTSNNERNIIDLSKCEFIEVMACPQGCINGGGQIDATSESERKEWTKAVSDKYKNVIEIDQDDQEQEYRLQEWLSNEYNQPKADIMETTFNSSSHVTGDNSSINNNNNKNNTIEADLLTSTW